MAILSAKPGRAISMLIIGAVSRPPLIAREPFGSQKSSCISMMASAAFRAGDAIVGGCDR